MALGVAGWYHALGEVVTDVPCSGSTHQVSWRRGKLVLVDHDLRAEEVAAALGGEPPPCLTVLRAWRLAERTARMVKVDAETFDYFRSRKISLGSQFQAALLPEPLREIRERTTWLHELRSAGGVAPNKRKAIANTLRRMASAGVRASLATVDPWFDIDVNLEALPVGAPPRVRVRVSPGGRGRGQVADVFLPVLWLATVGVLDVANVDDRFVLAVRHAEAPFTTMTVDTVAWRRTPADRLGAITETVVIERGDDAIWHVVASSPVYAATDSSR